MQISEYIHLFFSTAFNNLQCPFLEYFFNKPFLSILFGAKGSNLVIAHRSGYGRIEGLELE